MEPSHTSRLTVSSPQSAGSFPRPEAPSPYNNPPRNIKSPDRHHEGAIPLYEPLDSHKISPLAVNATQGMSAQSGYDSPENVTVIETEEGEVPEEDRSVQSSSRSPKSDGLTPDLVEVSLKRKLDGKADYSEAQYGDSLKHRRLGDSSQKNSYRVLPEEKSSVAGKHTLEDGEIDDDYSDSDVENELSICKVHVELNRLNKYHDQGLLDEVLDQRSKLSVLMADLMDIGKAGVLEIEEQVDDIVKFYADDVDTRVLLDRLNVPEPTVTVRKRSRHACEISDTHELSAPELLGFIRESVAFKRIHDIWRGVELGLANSKIRSEPLFVIGDRENGIHLLFGLQVRLNQGSTSVMTTLIPLDSQGEDIDCLLKKLIAEIDAFVLIKKWLDMNPDYKVSIELGLDFKSPESSTVKLEVILEKENLESFRVNKKIKGNK